MSNARDSLRHVFHLLLGAERPRIRVLGAYPLDSGRLVLRFETQLPARLDEAERPSPVVHIDSGDAAAPCLELNASRVSADGFDLVRRAYSLTIARACGKVTVELTGAGGARHAVLDLDADRIGSLLREFDELACDASRDARYGAAIAGAPSAPAESAAPPSGITVAAVIEAPEADPPALLDTLESLALQEHAAWRALVATARASHDAAEATVGLIDDPRIECVRAESGRVVDAVNLAFERSAQDNRDGYTLFLRQGDVLEPTALARFAGLADAGAGARPVLAYSDIDHRGEGAAPSKPEFKPDFNRDLLYSWNYISDCLAISNGAFAHLAPRPATIDGAWRYELALKAVEHSADVAHIPSVLCHVSAPGGADAVGAGFHAEVEAAERDALAGHFKRRGIDALVASGGHPGVHRASFAPPADAPRISIVIPNKDHVDYLKPCIESIHAKAGYPDYEVVVVENNSVEQETFDYYRRLEQTDGRVRIVRYAGPFNYSKIVNHGVRATTGPLILLLNNDTKVITDGFLATLAGYFARPEVGVVGPRLLFPDGLVQHAGMALLESGRMGFLNQNLSTALHRGYLESLVSASACSTVLGACQMVRRETFNEVGGYCEDLAVTCNDIDFCWKVRETGLDVVYVPYAELFHKEFGTRSNDTATREQAEQSTRENQLMVRRWPKHYAEGDGFINPNLDPESTYFKLREPRARMRHLL